MPTRQIKSTYTWLVLVLVLAGCGSSEKKLVSKKYPKAIWGFATQCFINTTPISVENAEAFIAYAREEGYSWIELRDPDASFTVAQCRDIAAFACDNQIEIIYAIQHGLLDDDFWDVFERGVINAGVFNGPGYFRALTTGEEFKSDPSKLGWEKEEFERAIAVADRAVNLAQKHGIQFAVENSDGDIDGKGKPYYGLSEFLDQAHPDLLFQFDTANFFWVPKVNITAHQVEAFLRKHGKRMAYIHLKTAKDRKALPVLDDNPLSFDTIFNILKEHDVRHIAIELDAINNERQVYRNLETSLDYLIRNDFLTVQKR